MTDVDTLVENFEILGDWEERYRYIIDLGKRLPPMPAEDKADEDRVEGCMSSVWIKGGFTGGDGAPRLQFDADSDAFIVKGLLGLLRELYAGRTPEEVLALDVRSVFDRIGLVEHLSPTRQNGLFAVVDRLRGMAREELGRP
jgi:cysteine desulfuration protein SufE